MNLIVTHTTVQTTRHCVIPITDKDLELSEKQFFERFIGPAEYALING